MTDRRRTWILRIAVCALVAGCVCAGYMYCTHLPWATMFDFQAFYCAGKIVLAHGNPYLNQPLYNCESHVNPGFFKIMHNVTIPAPLPPYALLLLSPFSLLPWNVAAVLWSLLLFACMLVSIWLTSRLSSTPWYAVAAGLFCAMLFPTSIAGALSPLPIVFWLTAALMLRERRWNIAALMLGLGMIEPHVGLPVCAAVFLGIGAMRWRLALVAAGLLVLEFAFTPLSLAREYFALLHVHARAEVTNTAQHSLTFLLRNLGVGTETALSIGFWQYAIVCVAGIAIGIVLARRWKDWSWVVLTPAAFSVVGGPFVHLTEIAMAIPFCFALVRQTGSNKAAVALVLLSVPWYAINQQYWNLPFAALSVGVLVEYFWRPRLSILALCSAAAAGTVMYINPDVNMPIKTVKSVYYGIKKIVAAPATAYSSVAWGKYNALFLPGPYWVMGHIPTWLGLIVMVIAAASAVMDGVTCDRTGYKSQIAVSENAPSASAMLVNCLDISKGQTR